MIDLDALDEQTSLMSSPDAIAETPAFKEIVVLGDGAVDELLGAVRSGHDASVAIMLALHEITGETPYGIEDRGNVAAMSAAWVAWGEIERT